MTTTTIMAEQTRTMGDILYETSMKCAADKTIKRAEDVAGKGHLSFVSDFTYSNALQDKLAQQDIYVHYNRAGDLLVCWDKECDHNQ